GQGAGEGAHRSPISLLPSGERGEEGGARPPRAGETSPPGLWAWLAGLTLVLTVVVVGFYLIRSNNYGGWTAGPRWLMWLTPLWLLTMLPVVDRLGRSRVGRLVAYLLLGGSMMSMSYPGWNPWRHPWGYRFMDAHGGIPSRKKA